jgi:transcriptional regulator with XRE-family HTH domain
MARFGDKVMALVGGLHLNKAKTARAIGVDDSQFGKWIKGTAWPKPEQLLALARFLKVPCEYLVDDAQEELPQSSERDRDDQVVLGFLHALGLTRDEALRRLAGPGAAEAGVPPIVAGPRKPTPAEKKASDPPIVAGPRKKGPARKKADGAGGNRQGAG